MAEPSGMLSVVFSDLMKQNMNRVEAAAPAMTCVCSDDDNFGSVCVYYCTHSGCRLVMMGLCIF